MWLKASVILNSFLILIHYDFFFSYHIFSILFNIKYLEHSKLVVTTICHTESVSPRGKSVWSELACFGRICLKIRLWGQITRLLSVLKKQGYQLILPLEQKVRLYWWLFPSGSWASHWSPWKFSYLHRPPGSQEQSASSGVSRHKRYS